jgi:hypothetical protein
MKLSGWFVEDGDYYGPFETPEDACAFRDRHKIEGRVCHLALSHVSSREMTLDDYEREHRSGPHLVDPAHVLDLAEMDKQD